MAPAWCGSVTARLGVLAALLVVSTAHFDAVVHDVASLAPRRKMMGMSESTSTDSSIGCKNQTVLFPNGTVVSVASTVVAMELGAGNVTYGQLACNDDYVNVQNADYASSLVALNTVDALSSANLTYVFSSAAQVSANTIIYGVHATPVATTTATSSGVIISWIQGMPQIGPIASIWPSGTPPVTGTSGVFNVTGIAGSVSYATSSQSGPLSPSSYTGNSGVTVSATVVQQYIRNYTATTQNTGLFTPVGGPFPYTTQNVTNYWSGGAATGYTTFSYLSGYLFHTVITGLTPDTTYYYIVGNATGYSQQYSFTTPPGPSGSSAYVYPLNVGLIADIGQTGNTSAGMAMLASLSPQFVLNVGDLTYADVYKPCNFTYNFNQWVYNGITQPWTSPDDKSSCQLRWDTFLAVPGTQALFGSTLVINAPGNHEIENGGAAMATPTPSTKLFSYASGNYQYQSWSARFPNGMQATGGNGNPNTAGGIGDITSNLYFSHNLGPVHVLVLNSYFPFAPGSDQYNFAVADLAGVNRTATPWLFVMHHTPLYHTYHIHWKDSECFRAVYEQLYVKYNVDFVFAGHVHAFERTHPVIDYKKNSCGPIYMTLGDGGNIENPYRNTIDDIDPLATAKNNGTAVTWCESTQGGGAHGTSGVAKYGSVFSTSYNPNSKWGPGYQKPVNPLTCSSFTFQPGSNSVGATSPGLVPDPSLSGNYWCPASQPLYSAFRDPSFGFSFLTLNSDTSATFKWFRTSANVGLSGGSLVPQDAVTYTRRASNTCTASIATATAKINQAKAPSAPPSPAALRCGKFLINGSPAPYTGYPGYYAIYLGCIAGQPSASCCAAIEASVGLFAASNTSAYTSVNCLCEAETAGFMLGALGTAGNAPAGVAALPLLGNSGIMQQCVNLGLFQSMVYWPTGNASNPNDCGAGLVVPPNPLPGSTRAPYLMNVTSTSVVVKWRTAVPIATVVNYGTSAASLGSSVATDMVGGTGAVLDHAALITGLTAGTTYFYAVSQPAASQTVAYNVSAGASTVGNSSMYFKTAPAVNATASLRFWVHGDFGSQSSGAPTNQVFDSGHQAGVLASWLAYETASGRKADAWLATGDTVYNTGSDPLFQYNFFNIYNPAAAPTLSRMPVWPVIGNHDTYSWMFGTSIQQTVNKSNYPFITTVGDAGLQGGNGNTAVGYYTAFGSALPKNGEGLNGGPGVASGTWRYYSVNYGRVHMVFLDSMTTRSNNSIPWDPTVGTSSYVSPGTSFSALGSSFDSQWTAAGSPNQMAWLAADLKAVMMAGNTDWILCSYHHPSYSAGSHKSDVEIEMIEMRALYNPILEAGGVDICFHGHSHGYERMIPTAGFTGLQSSYNATIHSAPFGYTQGVDGGASVQVKPAGLSANKGTTYVVLGMGGQWSATSPTNYRFVTAAASPAVEGTTGSAAIDIVGNLLTLTYIGGGFGALTAGQPGDQLYICKGACPANLPNLVSATATPVSAPAKDANTIVYASFGDWGWPPTGANNSLLLNSAAAGCLASTGTNFAANCVGNQGYYAAMGFSQISQKAVANALGSTCQAYGGCDFVMNTADNFYDLGITGGVTDVQWLNAYVNVYSHPALAGVPFVGTLGNHDYSILSPTAAASQIAYTLVNNTTPQGTPLGPQWFIPAHNFQRVFTSSNGAVSLQVVSIDSTPLHDRYLYSGASGGGYATGASGADTIPNNVASNIVINPSVTAANGFTNGNYFNASNFQCFYSFATSTSSNSFTYYTGAVANPNTTTAYGWVQTPSGWAAGNPGASWGKASSGCKYSSTELGPLANPSARAATWAQAASWFQAGAAAGFQYQVMMSHFPMLSTQQRLTPFYDNFTAMYATLGAAAPQAYYNGHDHVMALSQNSAYTVNGAPTAFVTTGAGGVSDYPSGASLAAMPTGYATGATAIGFTSAYNTPNPMPAAGVAATAAYNPDVNSTQFWSNYNGFTMTTVNATFMKIEFFLINCTMQAYGQACNPTPIGPLNTVYLPAKPKPAAPTGTPVSSSLTLNGVNFAALTTLQQVNFKAAFQATLAVQLSVPANSILITSVTSTSRRRNLLVPTTTIAFTVYVSSAAQATTVSAAITTALVTNAAAFVIALNTQLVNSGVTGVSVTSVSGITNSLVPPPPMLRSTPATVTPWNAHKKISIGLGVGLGLGLGLPLIVTIAYCYRKKPQAAKVEAQPQQVVVVAVPVPVVVAEAPAASA